MTGIESQRAWLITEESATDEETSIVSILHGNFEVDRVKWFVQESYIARTASDPEKLDSGLRRRVAYPAEVSETASGNVHIICGHNPYLRARLVEGIDLRQDEDGAECLVWTELGQGD